MHSFRFYKIMNKHGCDVVRDIGSKEFFRNFNISLNEIEDVARIIINFPSEGCVSISNLWEWTEKIWWNYRSAESGASSASGSRTSLSMQEDLSSPTPWKHRRRASTFNEAHLERAESGSPKTPRKRSFSFHEQPFGRSSVPRKDSSNENNVQQRKSIEKQESEGIALPPPCTCPYFGESSRRPPAQPSGEIVIVSSDTMKPITGKNLEAGLLGRNNSGRIEASRSYELNSVVTWRGGRRGSSLGGCFHE